MTFAMNPSVQFNVSGLKFSELDLKFRIQTQNLEHSKLRLAPYPTGCR